MIVDSNIIIYAAKPEHVGLRRLIAAEAPAVSAISLVEVLGYHRLTDRDRKYFEMYFLAAPVIPISDDILGEATRLRQLRKMSLGDALIAATALLYERCLLTSNMDDFEWVPDLRLRNPL